jgi:hypothetical protein
VGLAGVEVLLRPRMGVNHLGLLEGEPLDLPDLVSGEMGSGMVRLLAQVNRPPCGRWRGCCGRPGAARLERGVQPGPGRGRGGVAVPSDSQALRIFPAQLLSDIGLFIGGHQVVGLHGPIVGRAGQARRPVLDGGVVHPAPHSGGRFPAA